MTVLIRKCLCSCTFISTCVVVSVCSMYMYQLHVHVYDVCVVRVSRVIIFKVTASANFIFV